MFPIRRWALLLETCVASCDQHARMTPRLSRLRPCVVLGLVALGVAMLLASAPMAMAQEEATKVSAEVAQTPAATAAHDLTYTINTIVMFICAVLVLFMQAGFAMVETGLNASKNAVNILAKNLMDLAVGVLLFFIIGFGLMYPGAAHSGGWFGFGGIGIGGVGVEALQQVDATADYSPNADFLFQVAFAATAATIVSGAVAGRMRFGAYLMYSAVLTGLIYPISGMWKWGGGWLDAMGFQDFAGSIVVHAVGGFAGLAGALILGPRIGRFVKGKSIPMPGHNLGFAALGVFILWVGWYGFNPGSNLAYADAASVNTTVYIAVTTTLAGAAGSVVAMFLSWGIFKKPDLTMGLNGVLAGLVGITANCDQVSLLSAIVIGAIAGALVVMGVIMLDKLRVDDPVGAWPVHGLCGVWGGIATGLFGINLPEVAGETLTRSEYIVVQLIGTGVICAWAFGTMLVLFLGMKAIGVLRVSPEDEQAGLDLSEHGMHAYPPQWVVDSLPGTPLSPSAGFHHSDGSAATSFQPATKGG